MSVLANITAELIDRLENITTDNSYSFTVAKVEEVNRDKNRWSPVELGIMVAQMAKERNRELDCLGNPNGIGWRVFYDVYGYAKQLDKTETDFNIKSSWVTDNVMLAAIEKAIADSDAAMWMKFGTDADTSSDNAINADFETAEPWDFTGFDGAKVSLWVDYRVSQIDPAVPI